MSRTPEQIHANFEHCAALQRANRLAEAAACYTALLAEAPYLPQAHYNLGLAQKGQGLHETAAQSFRSAIRLEPGWAEAYVNLALALQQIGQFSEAERSSRQALRLKPDLPQALFAHGSLLRELGRFEAAIDQLSEAVRRHPDVFSIRNNLGLALQQMGRLPEAEASFRAALAIEPGNPSVLYNLGELDLLAGRFAEGWEGLEYRWLLEGSTPSSFKAPLWDGHTLHEGTLLLHTEQGMGDTVQFCRFVPMAAERARTIVMVTADTHRLLAHQDWGVPVVIEGGPVPDHTVQCPLPSLPRALRTTLETIPGTTPYLHPKSDAAEYWRSRLAALPGLKVGLVWAGNPKQIHDRFRSIPLALFTPLLTQPGVSFISLQKGAGSSQLDALPPRARPLDWAAETPDLADTAALIDGLDLVIGVDTGLVHLAGALGKPVWLLNRFDGNWRWLLGRDDSPWYPTLRQFRQTQPGDWKGVMGRVSRALTERVTSAG